jgi:quaternary ammonium compound-resistance protein SugE
MTWVILLIAGLFEMVWAIGLNYTEGFTRLWPTGAAGRCHEIAPDGTAYAMIIAGIIGLKLETPV